MAWTAPLRFDSKPSVGRSRSDPAFVMDGGMFRLSHSFQVFYSIISTVMVYMMNYLTSNHHVGGVVGVPHQVGSFQIPVRTDSRMGITIGRFYTNVDIPGGVRPDAALPQWVVRTRHFLRGFVSGRLLPRSPLIGALSRTMHWQFVFSVDSCKHGFTFRTSLGGFHTPEHSME